MATKKDKAIEKYAKKLYRGELPRLKEKLKQDDEGTIESIIRWLTTDDASPGRKGKRLAPTSSQGKAVVDKHKRMCGCCPKKYDSDPGDFQIHHIDGDRSHTITANLLPACHSCHTKIHTIANAMLKDYSVTHKRKPKEKTKYVYNPYGSSDD